MKKICKLLIVEDSDEIQQLLQYLFVDEGYHLVIASNGAQMREQLDAHLDIDVVIIDVTLPGGVDGFTLAEEASARGHGVILVTADHRHFERLEKSGRRYLLKPFEIPRLLQLVEDELLRAKNKCIHWAKQHSYNQHPRSTPLR